MSRSRRSPRWIAGALVAALLALATLGLGHVCSDAHARDGLTPDCAICRVVSSAAAVPSDNARLLCKLTTVDLLTPVPHEAVSEICGTTSRSRGPPLLS